jgi:hypothetical protein
MSDRPLTQEMKARKLGEHFLLAQALFKDDFSQSFQLLLKATLEGGRK